MLNFKENKKKPIYLLFIKYINSLNLTNTLKL